LVDVSGNWNADAAYISEARMKTVLLIAAGVFAYVLLNTRYHFRCDGTLNDPACKNMFTGGWASLQGK
jgi:hypothetical protein